MCRSDVPRLGFWVWRLEVDRKHPELWMKEIEMVLTDTQNEYLALLMGRRPGTKITRSDVRSYLFGEQKNDPVRCLNIAKFFLSELDDSPHKTP